VRHKRLLLEVVDNITGVLDTMEEKEPEATEEETLPVVGSKGAMPSFDEVFMVSALSGDGVEQVKVITKMALLTSSQYASYDCVLKHCVTEFK